MTIKTKGLIEQHIHGTFGINFNTAKADDIIDLSIKLLNYGISMFFPTLVTDSIENLKKQINEIKSAKEKQPAVSAKIIGVHLEGPFINLAKKGIHDEKHILIPNIENFKLLEDEIIKIVTIAPEFDTNNVLCNYLKSKDIKVSAGHTLTTDLKYVNQVTHLFNAMGTINHKENSTAIQALLDDNIYTEVIGDSIHINDEVLKLVFKIKPKNKIILISDCLPIAHTRLEKIEFSNETIHLQNNMAVNDSGTLAGSTILLPDIIKNLVKTNIIPFKDAISMASENISNYHNLKNNCDVYWDENFNIVDTQMS